jgi:hypothetical protein
MPTPTVTPIDLKPPREWLDKFPLSREEVKALNISLEWAIRLPTTLNTFQRELSLDISTMKKFQADIDILVKLYIKLRTYGEDYRANVLPSILSIAKDLRVHSSLVESHYGAVYSGLEDFKNKDNNHDWPRMLISQVAQRVTLQMDRTSNTIKTAVDQLSTLKDKISADRLVALDNSDRLKAEPVMRYSNDKAQATSLEIIQLQYDVFLDSLFEIVGNTTTIIAILGSMRDQLVSIRDGLNIIREAVRGEEVPANLVASDSPNSVYREWQELSTNLSELLS